MTDFLFTKYDIHRVIEGRGSAVGDAVQKLEPNYLLNASEDDLVKALADEFQLEVPVLKENDIHVAEHGETKVDISGDPRRFIRDRSQPLRIPGNRTVIAIPFEGDASFFEVQPQTYTMNPPIGKILKGEIHLIYERTDHDAEAVKREYQNTLGQIQSYLEWLRKSADAFNGGLPALVKDHVQRRKARLLADAGMVSALGLPVKRRAGAPTTYAVPVERRRPRIERPKVDTAKFRPEPTLAKEEYDTILTILRNMVRVMEQSPNAFRKMAEEDLRSHFLVQLNGQYEGQATGETFNYQGKTDILIRTEGRNVFIAECKIWKGEKVLLGAIDQILSYASWRDTKTAILIFNRKANFSAVLGKIEETLPKHRFYKKSLDQADESTFRYVFRQPSDPNRELLLTVMAFDVPTGEKAEGGT